MAAKKKKTSAKKTTPQKKVPQKKALQKNATERRFWDLLEAAWETASPQANAQREALVTRELDEEEPDTKLVDKALDKVIAALRTSLSTMSSKELTAIDVVIERKLYDIDRSEIQEVTDGSDDGFLYARGFIVALGEQFYDAVNANPRVAIMDAECEEICYLAYHLHEKRFGAQPQKTKISRESCSNEDGWDGAD